MENKLEAKYKLLFSHNLGAIPFVYDEESYQSIQECMALRMITKNMWKPDTVPHKHMSNCKDFIGFLVSRKYNECWVPQEFAIVKPDMNFEFSTIVGCRLFVEYYEQVLAKSKSLMDLTRIVRKYEQMYSECHFISEFFKVDTDIMELKDYCLSEQEVGVCILDTSNPLTDEVVSKLPKMGILQVSANSFKALSKSGFNWINKYFKGIPIEIVCKSEEEYSDYYWELVKNSYNPDISLSTLDYDTSYTVIVGEGNGIDFNKVNWDRAYIIKRQG